MSDTSGQPVGRCVTADVDLAALAAAYEHRPLSAPGRGRAMRAIADLPSSSRVLDIGGGPGAHAALWAAEGHVAVVVDPSRDMLAAAAARAGVVPVRATAQRLPFHDAVFALAYFHLSIHYGEWRAALDEALRVLGPDGVLWIWTLGPDHHANNMLQRWFPSVEAIDRNRFPEPDELAAHLRTRAHVTVGHVVEPRMRRAGEWVRAVEAGFVSTLQFVPAAELAAGLAAFRRVHPDPDETIEYELRWTWLVARV